VKRVAALLVCAGVLFSGCGERLTTGPALYNRHCGACHGNDLAGAVGPALGAGSEAAADTDAAYRAVVREGAEGMPPDRRLTDEQLDTIIAYIRQVQDPSSS
jgi:cytochrome c oxidase cbb3-type subunit 3